MECDESNYRSNKQELYSDIKYNVSLLSRSKNIKGRIVLIQLVTVHWNRFYELKDLQNFQV